MNETILFEVKPDALATAQNLSIDANFAEMEAYLTEMLAPYKSLVVTDMGAAKSARAYVNKVKKSINDSRLMVKKLYSAPLAAFEDKCKVLTAICDEASGAIDAQIKAVEQKEKDARIAALREYYDARIGDIGDYLTFERIYNPKWETKSYGTANAEAEIDGAIERAAESVDAIRSMESQHEAALLILLRDTGDMTAVLRKKAELDRLSQKLETPAAPKREGPTVQEPEPMPEAPTIRCEREYVFTLEFTATREQALQIERFFKNNGIKYRKV